MKRNKKAFSFLLTLCMLFSILLGSIVTVHAENILIQSATVNSLPVISPGMSITDATADIEVPEGCNVRSIWMKWDPEAADGFGEFVEITSGTFDETSLYKFQAIFTPEDGYTFDGYIDISFADGIDSENIMTWGSWDENDNEEFYLEMPVVSFATAIYKVELTLPEVKPGNTASIGDIVFYSGDEIISNDNFEINAYWECSTQNYEVVTDQTFEENQAYQYFITAIPKDGYYFAESLQGYTNGEEQLFPYDSPTSYEEYPYFTLFAPCESIELKGFPESVVGNTLPESLEIVSDIEDVEVFIYWEDENYEDVTGQIIEADKAYTAYIDINSYGNIPLSEDFVFIIDGKEYIPTELILDSQQAFLQIPIEGSSAASAEVSDDVNEAETSATNPIIYIGIAAAVVIVAVVVLFIVRKKKK